MSFNISKCHIMHVTRSRKVKNTSYTLHNQPLTTVNQATYLGVELTSNLSWGAHVNKVSHKASQSLGFLKRNLHSAKPDTKTAAYTSLVRPILEYSSSAWDPYTAKDKAKIENVQRSAARYVTNNFDRTPGTVTNILTQLNWNSLESRRQTGRLVLFYKIVHGFVDIPCAQYLTPYTRQSRNYHHLAYQIPVATVDYLKFSYFPRTVCLWNTLPSHVVSADSVLCFKSGLATLTLP